MTASEVWHTAQAEVNRFYTYVAVYRLDTRERKQKAARLIDRFLGFISGQQKYH